MVPEAKFSFGQNLFNPAWIWTCDPKNEAYHSDTVLYPKNTTYTPLSFLNVGMVQKGSSSCDTHSLSVTAPTRPSEDKPEEIHEYPNHFICYVWQKYPKTSPYETTTYGRRYRSTNELSLFRPTYTLIPYGMKKPHKEHMMYLSVHARVW